MCMSLFFIVPNSLSCYFLTLITSFIINSRATITNFKKPTLNNHLCQRHRIKVSPSFCINMLSWKWWIQNMLKMRVGMTSGGVTSRPIVPSAKDLIPLFAETHWSARADASHSKLLWNNRTGPLQSLFEWECLHNILVAAL